jgi:hypothetical protein
LDFGFTVHLNLVLAENAEEAMIVNSSLLVFPEVVHKAIKLLLVDLKVETQKYICKVPSVDDAASVFVNQLE